MTQSIPNATSALTGKANKTKSSEVARNDYFFGSIRTACYLRLAQFGHLNPGYSGAIHFAFPVFSTYISWATWMSSSSPSSSHIF